MSLPYMLPFCPAPETPSCSCTCLLLVEYIKLAGSFFFDETDYFTTRGSPAKFATGPRSGWESSTCPQERYHLAQCGWGETMRRKVCRRNLLSTEPFSAFGVMLVISAVNADQQNAIPKGWYEIKRIKTPLLPNPSISTTSIPSHQSSFVTHKN